MQSPEIRYQERYTPLGIPESFVYSSLTYIVEAISADRGVIATTNITFFPTEDRIAKLNRIYVVPELRHRHLGIGSKLYGVAETFAETQSAHLIEVNFALHPWELDPEVEFNYMKSFFEHRGFVIALDLEFNEHRSVPGYIAPRFDGVKLLF
jgi:hypothetical protein